ncbi:MAG: NAD-dependent epimerase/dehydratase family protein [Rhodocyclaceae bacterium]|nr:NAD-dependent epimerase/dehydratase family protein [Rhodocyclaceae bacterium]
MATIGRSLITGGNGFIGKRLIQPGDKILVTRRTGSTGEIVGDVLAPATLASACEGVETVFHCAGPAAMRGGEGGLHWRVHVEGTKNLLAIAVASGVRCFVYFSSVKAMADPNEECVNEEWPGEPSTSYGRAKREAEEAVLEAGAKHGIQVVNLRLAMVYGRGSRSGLWKMAQGIRAGWFPRLPEMGNKRSIVHVEDVVAAARLVAARPEANGRTYIVADPRPYSTNELEQAIRSLLPAPIVSWTLPGWVLPSASRLNSRLAAIVKKLTTSECYLPERIERELGWRARMGLIEGLREMLEA